VSENEILRCLSIPLNKDLKIQRFGMIFWCKIESACFYMLASQKLISNTDSNFHFIVIALRVPLEKQCEVQLTKPS